MLTGQEIQDYVSRVALELPLVEETFPFGPEHKVYKISGKMFAMCTDGPGFPIVNFKCDPEESHVLQLSHVEIFPAWHMNKRHWISVREGATITRQLLQELTEDAYMRIVLSLPQSKRPIEYRNITLP